MKRVVILVVLFYSFLSFAEQREAHGNPEDEKKCFKEIRNMGCANPDDHEAFVACVNKKVKELTGHCQTFHNDEVERMKAHSHSH